MSLGNELERALRKIGREDVIRKCMYNIEEVTDEVERAVAKVHIDQAGKWYNLVSELFPSLRFVSALDVPAFGLSATAIFLTLILTSFGRPHGYLWPLWHKKKEKKIRRDRPKQVL